MRINVHKHVWALTIQQNVVLNFDIYWYDKTTLDNKISKY
jgi:uncharacterized protein YcfL